MMQSKQKTIYFLRGMGVGLFFAGCVFTILSKEEQSSVVKGLSKEEIMTAAKEYGMVEEMDAKLNELKNQVTTAPTKEEATPVPGAIQQETESEKEPNESQDKESEKKPNESQDKESEQESNELQDKEPEKKPNESQDKESEKKPVTPQPTVNASGVVQVEIVPGDNGKTVSQKLKDAGVIQSASKFNSYLKKYDHAKKLKIGTYQVKKTNSYYEIAKIITGK